MILVVEDDPSILNMIRLALGDAGFHVRTATSVESAVRICREKSPDLVVADLLLPDGLGTEVVRRLHEMKGADAPPTIMVSAHPHVQEKAADVGVSACLPKPFDLYEFYQTVDTLMHTDQTGGDSTIHEAAVV